MLNEPYVCDWSKPDSQRMENGKQIDRLDKRVNEACAGGLFCIDEHMERKREQRMEMRRVYL